MIDPASGLSEADLALILRHLFSTRHVAAGADARAGARSSVPLTAQD